MEELIFFVLYSILEDVCLQLGSPGQRGLTICTLEIG